MTQGDPKGQVRNDLSSGWDISDFVDGSVSEHGWNTSQIPRLVSLSGKHYDKQTDFCGVSPALSDKHMYHSGASKSLLYPNYIPTIGTRVSSQSHH